jgi:hypothetical protein
MNQRVLVLRLATAVALSGCLVIPEIARLWNRPTATATGQALRGQAGSSDCTSDLPSPPARSSARYFVDITDALGLDFEHVAGPLGTYFLPEVNGTGAAFFDFDGDGDLDLLMVNGGRSPKAVGEFPPGTRPESRLYRRDSDGRYSDVTVDSGLIDLGIGVSCAVGDVDNDGDVDVYLTKYGADRLFENDGAGHFTDISEAAGIDNSDYTTSAAFFDYDRDGRLDLVAVNYTSDRLYGHSVACGFPDGRVSYCGPLKFGPTVDRLYHNEGLSTDGEGKTHVRFRDVTEEAGLAQYSTNGFGVICADFDGDGWPDIFVANDMQPNRLWMNLRNGTFREEAVSRGTGLSGQGVPQAGMGAVAADFDGDGQVDIVSTHLSKEYATLYRNHGMGNFADVSREAQLIGPTSRHTGWGVAAIDLDHDGWNDLVIANGLVVPCHLHFPPHGEETFQLRQDTIADPRAFWRDYADQNLILVNQGGGRFMDASEFAGDFAATIGSARALVCADIDDDGDLDLLVTYCGQRARVFRNDVPKRGHWLQVRAIDPRLRRDAYGAEIMVVAADRRFIQLSQPSMGYLASHDPRVHFGLGPAGRYDRIVVHWPDGLTEEFQGDAADRSIELQRGSGTPIERNGL